MEDGRGGKEGDDERCKVDRCSIIVEEKAGVCLGGGEVPTRRPLGDVVIKHELCRDVADAVDGNHDVVRVTEGVAPVTPIRHPERDKDHARVHNEAE